MNRLRTLVFCLAALLAPTLAFADAADDAALTNGKVQIAAQNGDKGYRPTKNADYSAIRDKMMKRQALEEFAKFLSPMKLPKTLYIVAEECAGGAGASPYYTYGDRVLVMCYQFMKVVEDQAADIIQGESKNPKKFPMKVSRDGFIAAVFAGVVLHEAGHAMFDILGVPIFGREEDAADEMSTFVALQFKKQLADLVVASYADLWESFGDPPVGTPSGGTAAAPLDKTVKAQLNTVQCFEDPFCSFSDVHGTWQQRFYNTLCLTYGSDPQHYAFVESGGWLPKDRDCVAEYKQIYHAFATTVYPFIDKDLMAKVQARQWFQVNELK
jgi:Putative metallopeptidase